MQTQLRKLLLRGHPLHVKQAMIRLVDEKGIGFVCQTHGMTRFTINRWLLFRDAILSATDESVSKLQNPRRIRSLSYQTKYKKRHYPSNRRKKNPFVIISRYANSNYKLVCFRNHIEFKECDMLKPIALWSIAKRQRCKCALSGLPLTCENISVDHIIPVSQGGTNTVDNIRLVCFIVNRMKNTLSDQMFFELCQAITRHADTTGIRATTSNDLP